MERIEDNRHNRVIPSDRAPDGYYPQTVEDKLLSRSLNRKLDIFLLPFLSLLYLFNGLDRGSIGNAATQNFDEDVGIKPDDVNDAVSMFFITFVTFQPISAAVGRMVGARHWIPFLMLSWGIITIAQAFVHGRGALIAIRLLLGLFEAGFYPTAVFYLSTFYTRFDLGVRIGLFYGQYAVAGAFSGAIAYGIFQFHGSLQNWQYLFIIEGAVTVMVATAAWFWLPVGPGSAWFLTEAEKEFATERIRVDSERYFVKAYGPDGIQEVSQRLSKRDVKETVRDWKLWTILVCNICASVPSQAFSVFLPLVVRAMGYSSIEANLMSVPPYVCGAVGLYLFTLSSDMYKERGFHIIGGLVICLVGLIATVTILDNTGRYVALCVLVLGSYITAPLTVAWLSGNTPDPGKRSLVLGVNGFGNLSGVIGAQLFRAEYADRYLVPFYATLGFIAIALVGYIGYRCMLQFVNQSRAKKMAGWSASTIEDERTNNERLGDRKYTFVYSL
ncbi:Major facilitator superfamily domain containing protein [Elaphomyces granulatus]